ncbi:MAG: hypothetical protein ABI162_07085 [Luteolibacter sp.]
MSRRVVTLDGCDVLEDDFKRVYFTANADIDADGMNGQSRDPGTDKRLFAYAPGDHGRDALKNAGYPNGNFREILVCGSSNRPLVFNGGFHSKTAYFREEKKWDDPDRYLDSASVPYIVVEDFIRKRVGGVVLGCRARVTWRGASVECVVGDLGPLYKLGELSVAAADALGMDSNPRTGGVEEHEVLYELWPGHSAIIGGETFSLIRR